MAGEFLPPCFSFSSSQKGVDYVIALTHMRTPNDCRLAANVDEVDLILGGHDHVYEVKKVSVLVISQSSGQQGKELEFKQAFVVGPI